MQGFLKEIQKLNKEKRTYLNELFKNCPEEILLKMKSAEVPANYNLIYAGTPCNYIYLILDGKAKGIDVLLNGNLYAFVEVTAGDIIGDYEVFGSIKDYCISIRTITPCNVVIIPANAYLKWIKNDVNALFIRIQNLMNQLTNAIIMERQNLFLTASDRLALYIIKSYRKYGKNKLFCIRKTQNELAEILGYNVKTIYRGMQKLRAEGFINIHSGKINITYEQYQLLNRYAEKNLIFCG